MPNILFDRNFFQCPNKGFSRSPSVQLVSDIPRSVNNFSENITGGFRAPGPMGSSLKKSQ